MPPFAESASPYERANVVITLIGYRGSGKSSVGPRLAARLAWDFVDADPEIERRCGRSIREIFEMDGEPAFRVIEADTLRDLLARDQLVLAPGGGAVLYEATRRSMRQAGPVVWLKATVDVILQRLGNDPTTAARRPALTDLSPREEIEQLLARREPLYAAAATITVETNGRNVDELVEQICDQLSEIVPHTPPEDLR